MIEGNSSNRVRTTDFWIHVGWRHKTESLTLAGLLIIVAAWTVVDGVTCYAAQTTTKAPTPPSELSLPVTGFPDLLRCTDTSNAYLLRSDDTAILFNMGDGNVLRGLADAGIKKVEWILLTDHHRENCQGIAQAPWAGTSVAASEAEGKILGNPTNYRKWYPKLGDEYSVYGASYVRPPASRVSISRTLKPGEIFEWRGYKIRCLHTPGTSPGAMSFVLERADKKIAITGSVMYDKSRMTNWYDSEWDYGFAKGVDSLIGSVEKLMAEGIDIALPSQGPVIHNANEQFTTYAKKLRRFRAQYIRGYPVFDKDIAKRDPVSKPTAVPHINRVTPHLYKLSHKHPGKNFAIIVSDSGRGLVLDCGLFPKKTLEEIIVGMRQHMGLKQVDAFWISHMHGDHFLLGPMLKDKFGAEAWTLDKIVDRCEHPRRYDYAALVSAYGDGFDGMKIGKSFRDGETVQWEDYTIHVDWMPGQTEFGCCLWLDIDGKRIAFTGDNIFGSPADESQTGHEAVVCRNSCILEEGYIRGSKYLLDLKPDIVMGSHSFVMPDPRKFLQRYHSWSRDMARTYRELLPHQNYEYGFDPYWVSAYPYRVDLSEDDSEEVTITVRNFRATSQRHQITLRLPDGMIATPAVLEGQVPARSRSKYKVTLRRTESGKPKPKATGVQIVPFDITLDDRRHGELFDFLVRLPE